MKLRHKKSYAAKWVNRLAKYKWFRRACGGHWYKVTHVDSPSLEILAYWIQYEGRVDLPDNIEELREKGYSNHYVNEYWGDAYTFVGYVLETKK